MNERTRAFLKKGVTYSREFSAVITSIAITFLVSDYISHRKEKRTPSLPGSSKHGMSRKYAPCKRDN